MPGGKKKIAVFTTGWSVEILSQFLEGMTKALKDDNADIFLFLCYPTHIDTPAIKQGEMNIYNLPDLHAFDCAVIFASGIDFTDRVDMIVERTKEAGIPLIMQGAKRDGASYVGSDNYQATKDLCDHLRKHHGTKKITFFAGAKDSYDSQLRLNAVRDYLKENNCEDDLREVFYTKWENAAVTRRIDEIFDNHEELPDAFICANDGLAMECIVSLNRHGINVPEDVIVTGFDFLELSQIFDPSVASVDQCFEEMGAAAVKLWKELMEGAEPGYSEVIPCKFVPGESCGCHEHRNSDKLRRRKCREAFSERAQKTYANRKLDIIDSVILSSSTYDELKKKYSSLIEENHAFEGESFHFLMEPNFSLSIHDTNITLNTDCYSRKMEVIYSTDDGVHFDGETFETKELIPGYKCDGDSHMYIFLPLHESEYAYGYLVFKDAIDKLYDHYLHSYQNRLGVALDKFRHALTLDEINKRLFDLMRRDALTNVNNRMAFEDKTNYLQSMINSDPDVKFALAMFDVNSLKLINDSQGHEAGDEYLLRTCHLICDVFKHSPVYRMGGDEFTAVLTGEDYDNRDELVAQLNSRLSPYSKTLPLPDDYVSIACGLAVYGSGKDNSVIDVLKRADEEMYKDKTAKKSVVS